MFTGIITSQAVLKARKEKSNQVQLTFELIGPVFKLKPGESLALDGTCVTVTHFSGRRFWVDLIPETLRSTTLGRREAGQRVNVERSLRLGDSVDGHWVTGHVDGVGAIRKIERRGENFRLHIEAPADIIRLLVEKGSIAVDGISFTVQGIAKRCFIIGVTPHTYRATTLPLKRVGESVNLETDLFAKFVKKFIETRKQNTPLKIKTLQAKGF